MRIKTLTDLESHFETLTKENQREIVGGYYQVLTSAGYTIDIPYITSAQDFLSDNDPNTFGGGSFSFLDGYGNLQTRNYSGTAFDQSIQLVGSLSGYETPISIYYDTLSSGYFMLYGDNTILDDTSNESYSITSGDYHITYSTTINTYFDDLAGGYITTYIENDPLVIYTGYETLTAEILAQRIAAEAAQAKLERENARNTFQEFLKTYNTRAHQPKTAVQLMDAMIAEMLADMDRNYQTELLARAEAAKNALDYWKFFESTWQYHQGNFNEWNDFRLGTENNLG